MTDKTDRFHASVTSEKLRAVYDAWKELAAGRIGPRRAELTPAKLRRATPWTFLVDVIDGGKDFRLRFRGDRVIQFVGDPCGATTLAAMRGATFFDVAESLFRKSVESRKPLLSGPRRTHLSGKEHLEREVVLLPLSDDGMNVTGLLGAVETWQLGTYPHALTPLLAE